ncbi:MAG: SDR family NAD(P)-dependent oxidoreductase [Desulfobacteraceae bacterium]|nr:SDR family NAD(P)-dependent oxidoreductase [Desulfobacteraceae bacterium]
MKEFKGKVAVITGAASGIGRSIAEHCVQEGMKVVLADIDETALSQAKADLKAGGADILTMRTDVSEASDIEALARKTLEAFGAVHLLCNNAGVLHTGTPVWESTFEDWQWIMGINLWGVIHGVRVFVPLMLAQDTGCHVVNTASMSGLISGPGVGAYNVTKHGVITLSETLYHDLKQREAKVKVSVLCPGFVMTRILTSERSRPVESQGDAGTSLLSAEEEEASWAEKQAVHNVLSPGAAADAVFTAIRNEQFYILTHPELKGMIQVRMEDIINGRNPAIPGT